VRDGGDYIYAVPIVNPNPGLHVAFKYSNSEC